MVVNDKKQIESCVDLYFLGDGRRKFKLSAVFHPYFYVLAHAGHIKEVMNYLGKRFSETLVEIDACEKIDLDMPNHLSGRKQTVIRLTFYNSDDLDSARRDLAKIVALNKASIPH